MSERRRTIQKNIENEVLLASGRRCCLCVFLDNRDEVRKGQLAHLNRDAGDDRIENLVWLCLEHHDDYDSRTSQSKGLSTGEVRAYRDQLYAKRGTRPGSIADPEAETGETVPIEPLPEISEYESLRIKCDRELGYLAKPWRYPLWQVANEPELFAYKAGNGSDGICLIERIDLPDSRIVIACIEVAGNPGNSITNCVEELCFQVCERFEIPGERLVWLEHYDFYDDEWNMLRFEETPPHGPFSGPSWIPMTPELWNTLRLRPKKRLAQWYGHYHSKIVKRFNWPTQNLE